jgi:hypothetical protein
MLVLPAGRANGTQGGLRRMVAVHEGSQAMYVYNFLGLAHYAIASLQRWHLLMRVRP